MDKKSFRLCVIFCLVIFISLGAAACVLSDRRGAKLDITENRLYTLSDETTAMLDGLDKKVTLTVFNLRTDLPAIISNLLDSYEGRCGNIDVIYLDPYRAPQRVRALNERGFNVDENDIAVECDENVKLLKMDELYKLNESKTEVETVMAERQISSTIAYTVNGEKGNVLFTDGHGETPSASLMVLFENNGYKTSYAELSVSGIAEDTRLIVICAPKKDATAQETKLLSEYMENGGAVMYFAAAGAASPERFTEFFAERGIGITDEIMREPSLCISGNELNIAATYASHEINGYFAENRCYVVTPSTCALEQLYIKQGRTKTAAVLRSSSQSYSAEGGTGSRQLCMSSVRTMTAPDGGETEQRVLVFGSTLIYGDDLLSESKLANADFLLQCTRWLIGDGELMNIPVKNMRNDILPATGELTKTYAAVMAVGAPLAILAVGLGVCLKRRYL